MEDIYLVDGPEVRHAEGSGQFPALYFLKRSVQQLCVHPFTPSPLQGVGAVRARAPAAERRVFGLRSPSVQTRRYHNIQVSFNSMNKSAPGQCQGF